MALPLVNPCIEEYFKLPIDYCALLVDTTSIYKNIKTNICNTFHFQVLDNSCLVSCSCNVNEGCGNSCQNRLLYM